MQTEPWTVLHRTNQTMTLLQTSQGLQPRTTNSMPLPKPEKDEAREDFVKRCMASQASQEMNGTDAQRVAACETSYDDARKSAEGVETKSLAEFEIKDETKGEVQAIVATYGVVDRDKDIIRPDAV